jgi:hypothetical protein
MALTPQQIAAMDAALGGTQNTNTFSVIDSLKKGGAIATQAAGGLARFTGKEKLGKGIVDWSKQKQAELEQQNPSMRFSDIENVGGGVQYIAENALKTIPLAVGPVVAAIGGRALAPALQLGKLGSIVAGGVGAFAPALATETGIIASEADTVDGNRAQIMKGAIPAAAAESLSSVVGLGSTGLGNLAGKMGSKFFKQTATDVLEQGVKKSIPRQVLGVGRDLATVMGTEAMTESVQSPLEAWGAGKPVFKEGESLSKNPILNTVGALSGGMLGGGNFTPEMQEEMKESFFAGGAAGLGLGGAGKVISSIGNSLTTPKPVIEDNKNPVDVLEGETTEEVPVDSPINTEPIVGKSKKKKQAMPAEESLSPEEMEADSIFKAQQEADAHELIDAGLSDPNSILTPRRIFVPREAVPQTEAMDLYVKQHPSIMYDSARNIIPTPKAKLEAQKTITEAIRAEQKAQVDAQKEAIKANKEVPKAKPEVKVETPIAKEKATPKEGKIEGKILSAWASVNQPELYKIWMAKETSTELKKATRAQLEEGFRGGKVSAPVVEAPVQTAPVVKPVVTPTVAKPSKPVKEDKIDGKVLSAWAKENQPTLYKEWTTKGLYKENPERHQELKRQLAEKMSKSEKETSTPKVTTVSDLGTTTLVVPKDKGKKKDKIKQENKPKKDIDAGKTLLMDAHKYTPIKFIELWEQTFGKLSQAMKEKTINNWKKMTTSAIQQGDITTHKNNLSAAISKSKKPGEIYFDDTYTGLVMIKPANPAATYDKTDSVSRENRAIRWIDPNWSMQEFEDNINKELDKFLTEEKAGKWLLQVEREIAKSNIPELKKFAVFFESDITPQIEGGDLKLGAEINKAVEENIKKEEETGKKQELAAEIIKERQDAAAKEKKEREAIKKGESASPKAKAKRAKEVEVIPSVDKQKANLDVISAKGAVRAAEVRLQKAENGNDESKIRQAQLALDEAETRLAEAEEAVISIKKSNIADTENTGERLFGKGSTSGAKEYNTFLDGDKIIGASQSIGKEIRGFVEQLWKDFGLTGKVFVTTESDINLSSLKDQNESIQEIVDLDGKYAGIIIGDGLGNRIIALNDTKVASSNHLVNTLTHEIGHAIIDDHYNNASETTKDAIRDSFANWINKMTAKDVSALSEFYIRDGKTFEDFKEDMADYLTTKGKIDTKSTKLADKRMAALFHEYRAQQIAKYIRERQSKPEGVIDRFFKALAEKIRNLFNVFQANQIQNKRAIPSIESWLDGLLESQRVSKRLQEKQTKETHQALSQEYIELIQDKKKVDKLLREHLIGVNKLSENKAKDAIQFLDIITKRMSEINIALRNKEIDYEYYALSGSREYPFNLLVDASGEYKKKLTGLDEVANNMYPPNSGIPSTHFGTGNAIHIRGDQRTTVDGKKVLHINEMQSDWDKQYVKSNSSESLSEQDRIYLEAKLLEYGNKIEINNKNIDGFYKKWANLSGKVTAGELKDKIEGFGYTSVDDTNSMLKREGIPIKFNKQEYKVLKSLWKLDSDYDLRIIEIRQKLRAKGKEIAPPPIEGKYWMQHAIRQIIRYAQEKGIDTITFPSTPKQVAEVENWGALDVKSPAGDNLTKATLGKRSFYVDKNQDEYELTNSKLRYFTHNQDVTSIIDRMINRLPKYLNKLVEEYGGKVTQVEVPAMTGEDIRTVGKPDKIHTLNALVLSPALKAEAKRFGPKFSKISDKHLKREYAGVDEKILDVVRKAGGLVDNVTFKEKLLALKGQALSNWRQKLVDQFHPIQEISKQAYMQIRLAAGNTSGHLEALFRTGNLRFEDGVYKATVGTTTPYQDTLKKLEGEINRFHMWIAAKRAKELLAVGKEAMLSADEIDALEKLDEDQLPSGASRKIIYGQVEAEYRRIHNSVLDIAKQSGIITEESAEAWKKYTYIPFYRAIEDGKMSYNISKGGFVDLKVIKKLSGESTSPLNQDMMANVLSNWASLLNASAKNAAVATVFTNALNNPKLGISRTSSKDPKGVFFYKDGKKQYMRVDNEPVLDAITALAYTGLNGKAVQVLEKFKHYLTLGVTADPIMKVKNLMRDTQAVVALNPISKNVFGNLSQGTRIMKEGQKDVFTKDAQDYVDLLASGGIIRFGQGYEAKSSKRVQELINSGVKRNTIITRGEFLKDMWTEWRDKYNKLSDMSEGINRAALYKQLKAKGATDLEAAYAARDTLDFSMGGTSGAVRFLTSVIPFLNARIQGLDKMSRGYKEDPKRFQVVIAGTILASLVLTLAFEDDEDYKAREGWDKDSFWWWKVGNTAYRLPKPFELGLPSSLAVRMYEYMNGQATGKEFATNMGSMVKSTFGIDIVPQAFRPILNVARNKDYFTGKPIENPHMQALKPSERSTINTTWMANVVGKASDYIPIAPSPTQADYLVQGYFGWLGSMVLMLGDLPVKAVGDNERPARDPMATLTRRLIEELPASNNSFRTVFYDQLKEIEEAYKTHKHISEENPERAREFKAENKELLSKYSKTNSVKTRLTEINSQIRKIEANPNLDGYQKQARIKLLRAQANKIAKNYTT